MVKQNSMLCDSIISGSCENQAGFQPVLSCVPSSKITGNIALVTYHPGDVSLACCYYKQLQRYDSLATMGGGGGGGGGGGRL